MDSQAGYGYGYSGGLGNFDPYQGANRAQELRISHEIIAPRNGTSICFGFGGSMVLCYSSRSFRFLSISKVLRGSSSTPDLQTSIRREAKSKGRRSQLSQEEKVRIHTFLNLEMGRTDPLQTPRDYLRNFRKNCLFELLSLSTDRGYMVSNPSDYDIVFSGIKSHAELGIWRCYCEANGKPMEFLSGRSLLGFFCGTYGVSKALEMHRSGGVGPCGALRLEISWSDRFALSGFCGERELSSCYLDYVKSRYGEYSANGNKPGTECKCFEGVLEALYLSIAQKADQLEITNQVLELWPHYVYSVVSSLGTSHMGSRGLLTSISNGLLQDIRDKRSSLTHNERVFGWQFCTLLMGEYKEIPIGLNPSNLEVYVTCMDIVTLFMYLTNKAGLGLTVNHDSALNRYLSSLYFTELGFFERSDSYIEWISPYFSREAVTSNNLNKECEFLRIRIQERNQKLNISICANNGVGLEATDSGRPSDNQASTGSKNSSWFVGWISDNIKKAIGTEEERWPGVENTFYFDKEINQWCQRGPDGKRMINEPPKADNSGLPGASSGGEGGAKLTSLPPPPPPPSSSFQRNVSGTGGTGVNSGVRSRYVDIFQNKK
ncbi:hypothetical protein OJ253_56 [Cryptosporidium canis]|uniref:Uncharacterized protein n=1 Tax=Cryptosporidium canis TaxID=195482 RepID=A0A9D5DJL6_9CRYT|nr:hypothetical protein OJ253_56 [Cryptosporidium canis]